MLAKLVANTTVTQAISNARMCDIAKLMTGAITSTAGLNATAWDIPNCYVNGSVPGNWSVWYQNIGTDLNTPGTSATWKILFSKTCADLTGKQLQWIMESTALATLYPYACSFPLNATTGTNPSPSSPSSGNVALALNVSTDTIIVGSNVSSAYIYSVAAGCLWGMCERPAAIYDGNSTEAPCVFWWTKGATCGAFISNMFQPSSKTYIAAASLASSQFNSNIITDAVAMTRDANRVLVSPMIPLYVEYLYNGWIGGSLTSKSSIYRTADSSGNTWDVFTHSGQNFRLVATGSLRYALLDA